MKNDDIAKNSLKCAGKFITKIVWLSQRELSVHDGIHKILKGK